MLKNIGNVIHLFLLFRGQQLFVFNFSFSCFFHRWMKHIIAGIHWAFPNLTYIMTSSLIAKLTTHLWWRCLSAILYCKLISYLYYSLIHNLLFDVYSVYPKISFHQQKRHRLRYAHLMQIFNSQTAYFTLTYWFGNLGW